MTEIGQVFEIPRQFTPPVGGPIRAIIDGLSACGPGESYFHALVRELTDALGVEAAFVAEVHQGDPLRGRMLACWRDGAAVPNREFRLANTPCGELLERGFSCYPNGVQSCFPDDRFFIDWKIQSYAGVTLNDREGRILGWIVVMSRDMLRETELIRNALNFVALRSSAELQRDIAERALRRAYVELEARVAHDPLTNLPNRAQFMNRLEHVIELNREQRVYDFAVLFLDLDRFKVVNDSRGHLAGDALLRDVADRFRRCVRPTDLVARLGGDEFTILLENVNGIADAIRVAECILHWLRLPFDVQGEEVYIGASIGVALGVTAICGGYESAEAVLRDADTAMYRAKRKGKGRYEVFDTRMHVEAVQRMQTEMDLRRAIDRDELRVAYQPVLSVRGALDGFEALVRWSHPVRGMVMPTDFIPIAEETGLIVPIGAWVLRSACEQLREWEHLLGATLTMSVNLSLEQLRDPDFVERVAGILDDCGIEPRRIRLEITESSLMEDADTVMETFARIQRLGIELCLDDFGTGYSSLSYLVHMPIDVLKIDRSFIASLGASAGSDELVRMIIALAHTLDLRVVAEGIETREQLERLAEFGCDFVQGFYFAQPLFADAAVAFARSIR